MAEKKLTSDFETVPDTYIQTWWLSPPLLNCHTLFLLTHYPFHAILPSPGCWSCCGCIKKHQHGARWIPKKCVYVKFVNECHFSMSKSWIRIKILYMFAERKVSWALVWYGHCALNLEGLFQSVPGASLFPMQNKIKLWDNIDTTLKHLWETCVIIWWFLAGGTIFLWAAYSHFYDQSHCFSDRKSIWQIGIFSKEQSTIAGSSLLLDFLLYIDRSSLQVLWSKCF